MHVSALTTVHCVETQVSFSHAFIGACVCAYIFIYISIYLLKMGNMCIYISMSRLRSAHAHRTSDVMLPRPQLLCPFYKSQQGESLGQGHPPAPAPALLSGLTCRIWAPSSRLHESFLPWTCDPGSVTAPCSTRTIRQTMRSYFGLYETWHLQSCTELRQDSTNCSRVQCALGIKRLGTVS